jgi:putative Holliday junction resolvase
VTRLPEGQVTGRVLGVDLGAQRIGLALSDPLGLVASPLMMWRRSGDTASDHAAIVRTAIENEAATIVVGVPFSMSGRPGRAARAALEEVAALAERAAECEPPVTVETHDERLTTETAQRSLATTGVPAKKRKGLVDMVAAALILQAWLDGHPRNPR